MEKVKIICGLVVIGMLLWVTPSIGQVSVDCSGQSLQTAINNNAAGTTFNVSGTCNENIVIWETRERVTLNGVGTPTPTINGTNTNSPTIMVWGQGVTVTGFTISGGQDGIMVYKGGTATINGNTIQYIGRVGINVILNGSATITNNTISNNPSAGIIIQENASARIGFSSTSDTVASGNTIQNNGLTGIYVSYLSNARIVGNTISDNTGSGIAVLKLSQADISDNDINHNGLNGITVDANSAVFLGELSGDTIFTRPNDTTVNNLAWGLRSTNGSYIYGRLGTLNGVSGVKSFGPEGIGTMSPQYDFDVVAPNNGLIRLGNTETDSTNKVARMVVRHYNNAEEPVYLFGAASTSTNNFVAFGGGSPVGNAATQLDLFTAETTTTPVGSPRITIKGNGYVGIGTQTPSYPLEMVSGAHVTAGGVWTDASSREYKDNIEALATEEALDTLKELNPVKFAYKTDRNEKHVGFIAEEVPELIATKDRKGLSAMDIVAVLTKVVQEQQKTISTMREELKELQGKVR